MDSDMEPPKYEEVVLTPPNSSVFTPSVPIIQYNPQILPAPDQEVVLTPPNSSVYIIGAPGQYNLQIPDQSPPPQLYSPQVRVSVKAQCVSCPSYHKKVMTKVIVGYCIIVYCICILSLVYLGKC